MTLDLTNPDILLELPQLLELSDFCKKLQINDISAYKNMVIMLPNFRVTKTLQIPQDFSDFLQKVNNFLQETCITVTSPFDNIGISTPFDNIAILSTFQTKSLPEIYNIFKIESKDFEKTQQFYNLVNGSWYDHILIAKSFYDAKYDFHEILNRRITAKRMIENQKRKQSQNQ
jgi:hypothetical protein